MIDNLKEAIKLLMNKFGYQIASISRYKILIAEMEGLYKEHVFRDYVLSDDTRLRLMANLMGTGISEAIYILYYLNRSLTLAGDVCEFGVAQGATSALMAHEIRNSNKNIWLFDSFKGLPKPHPKDTLKDDIFNLGSIEAYEGKMAHALGEVSRKLRTINFPFSQVKIVPGFIEETIKSADLPKQVCFAYVDFDFYEPTTIALGFLDTVLQPNGFVIVDDYDFFSTGVKTAVDEFIAAHHEHYSLQFPRTSAGRFCVINKLS